MRKLLIATTNPGKLKEISNFLSDLPLEIVSLSDVDIKEDIEEVGKTYKENSQMKALFYSKKSGLPAIADDGGIEISALNGVPGIKSRRWLGKKSTEQDIIKHMLKVADELPKNNRRAFFKTVISFALPSGKVWSVSGEVEGIIAPKPYLKTLKGYPYRSFFYLPQIKKYYHEDQLTSEEEKEYNHRYKAIAKLKPIIQNVILTPLSGGRIYLPANALHRQVQAGILHFVQDDNGEIIMVDIKFLRNNPQLIQKAARDKGVEINVDHILEIDKKYRELLVGVQKLREERNKLTDTIKGKPRQEQIEKGKILKEKLEKQDNVLRAVWEELKTELLKIPNPAKSDVKVGKNDTENEVLRKVGTPTKFNFKPKDHLELGEKLDIIDTTRASKISGARFYFLKNEGVLLEFALRELAFEILIKEGFIPVLPPVLIKKEIMKGLGYMEKGGDEDMYILEKDDLVLVGTSEQSIVSMHKDEILDEKEFSKRYVGFSTCFRREAGTYGKDTKGILRAHQFDKIEMVSFVKQGEDDKEHEYLLSLEEKLLQVLKIPYQVVKMCTGDLGFPAARKYDLEAWIPSENKYREVTSTSTTTDFQARRLNIKYRGKYETQFVNILNGTAFSTRPIIVILENYQQKDGSVLIPKILQKYLNCEKISPKNQ